MENDPDEPELSRRLQTGSDDLTVRKEDRFEFWKWRQRRENRLEKRQERERRRETSSFFRFLKRIQFWNRQ